MGTGFFHWIFAFIEHQLCCGRPDFFSKFSKSLWFEYKQLIVFELSY
jgi:hypothetical protein